jgi:hypothetical protein
VAEAAFAAARGGGVVDFLDAAFGAAFLMTIRPFTLGALAKNRMSSPRALDAKHDLTTRGEPDVPEN